MDVFALSLFNNSNNEQKIEEVGRK